MVLSRPEGFLSQDKITQNYEFDVRQTQYYTSAGRYLGLIESSRSKDEGTIYQLTAKGRTIAGKDARSRNLALVEIILSRRVFREAMEDYLKTGELPPIPLMIQRIIAAKIKIGNSTPRRRAQTVISWIRWIAKLTKDA